MAPDKMLCTPPDSRSSSCSAYGLGSDLAAASPFSDTQQSRLTFCGDAADDDYDEPRRESLPPQHKEGLTPATTATAANPATATANPATAAAAAAVSPPIRASMVDWMCSTAAALALCPDALFLGVTLLDRYLAARPGSPPPPGQLGACACACLALAAKFEAASSPPLRAYLAFLSPRHTLEQLCEAEVAVLVALDHRLAGVKTARAALLPCLQRLGAAGLPDGAVHHTACYLAELALLEVHLAPVPAAELAAACLVLALLLNGVAVSDDLACSVTGHTLRQLERPLAWLAAVHSTVCAAAANGAPYAATRKYAAPCRGCVAAVSPPHGGQAW